MKITDVFPALLDKHTPSVRRSFAQQILAGVDDAHRDGLAKLLGKS